MAVWWGSSSGHFAWRTATPPEMELPSKQSRQGPTIGCKCTSQSLYPFREATCMFRRTSDHRPAIGMVQIPVAPDSPIEGGIVEPPFMLKSLCMGQPEIDEYADNITPAGLQLKLRDEAIGAAIDQRLMVCYWEGIKEVQMGRRLFPRPAHQIKPLRRRLRRILGASEGFPPFPRMGNNTDHAQLPPDYPDLDDDDDDDGEESGEP
eukprot:scaffold81003_cov17-Prasinocladus_malaysianus.AAC.3